MPNTKGATTRQRILDAVGPLFNERGYQATTLAAVEDYAFVERSRLHNAEVRARFVAELEALGSGRMP